MLCCAVNLCSSLTHRLFKQKVSKSKSSVKISDQVDRNNAKLIEAVFWSSLLDNVFKENLENDPELRYVITHQLTDVFSANLIQSTCRDDQSGQWLLAINYMY